MTGSLVQALYSLIGTYNPGSATGASGWDIPWVASALVLLLFLWFLFQLILIIVRGGSRRG